MQNHKGEIMKKDISKETNKGIKWDNPVLTNLTTMKRSTMGYCATGDLNLPCVSGTSAATSACVQGGLASPSSCIGGTDAGICGVGSNK
jgi:hypothetical protein